MHRNKEETCRNEVKSYITREGMTMEQKRPQPVRQAAARVAQIHRGRGVGRCAGL